MSLYVEVLQPNALDSLNLTEIDVTATDEDDMEFFEEFKSRYSG